MSQSLAQELAEHGITVNVYSPGVVQTPDVGRRSTSTLADRNGTPVGSEMQAMVAGIPLGRLEVPADVAGRGLVPRLARRRLRHRPVDRGRRRHVVLLTLLTGPRLVRARLNPGSEPPMHLYLDTADRAAAEPLLATGLFAGLTTNPTILQRASRGVADIEDIHALGARGRGARRSSSRPGARTPATLVDRGLRLSELGPRRRGQAGRLQGRRRRVRRAGRRAASRRC